MNGSAPQSLRQGLVGAMVRTTEAPLPNGFPVATWAWDTAAHGRGTRITWMGADTKLVPRMRRALSTASWWPRAVQMTLFRFERDCTTCLMKAFRARRWTWCAT